MKQAAAKAGIEMELKSVVASVYFSSDPANWDTYPHFGTDLQMYTTTMTQPDPQRFMDQFCSWEVATKENKWQGRNPTRWKNEEYDKTWRAAEAEMDPVKRAVLFVKMNDLLIQNVVVIPVTLAVPGGERLEQAQELRTERLGFRLLEPGQLVSRGVAVARPAGAGRRSKEPVLRRPAGLSRPTGRRAGPVRNRCARRRDLARHDVDLRPWMRSSWRITMDERELREWTARVKHGSLSRREFTAILAGARGGGAGRGAAPGPRRSARAAPRPRPSSPRRAGAAGAS